MSIRKEEIQVFKLVLSQYKAEVAALKYSNTIQNIQISFEYFKVQLKSLCGISITQYVMEHLQNITCSQRSQSFYKERSMWFL